MHIMPEYNHAFSSQPTRPRIEQFALAWRISLIATACLTLIALPACVAAYIFGVISPCVPSALLASASITLLITKVLRIWVTSTESITPDNSQATRPAPTRPLPFMDGPAGFSLCSAQEIPPPRPNTETHPPTINLDKLKATLRNKNPSFQPVINASDWKESKNAIASALRDKGVEGRWELIVSNGGLNLLHSLLIDLIYEGANNDEAISFLISKGLSRHRDHYGETPLQLFITLLIRERHLWAHHYKKGVEIPPSHNYNAILSELLADAKKNGDDMDAIADLMPAEFNHLL